MFPSGSKLPPLDLRNLDKCQDGALALGCESGVNVEKRPKECGCKEEKEVVSREGGDHDGNAM